MEFKTKMNYRGCLLSKYEKSCITKSLKNKNLENGSHTIRIDVGKSFCHIIELEIEAYSSTEFKRGGVGYEHITDIIIYEAKYIKYHTSTGTLIDEKIIRFI